MLQPHSHRRNLNSKIRSNHNNRRRKLSADDVAVIAEAITSLHTLLDRFHSQHGEELGERLEAAWPAYHLQDAKALVKLERELTPPDHMQD